MHSRYLVSTPLVPPSAGPLSTLSRCAPPDRPRPGAFPARPGAAQASPVAGGRNVEAVLQPRGTERLAMRRGRVRGAGLRARPASGSGGRAGV
eukprot:scaffold27848_cov149-Isochrysis_galbana.AAC.3